MMRKKRPSIEDPVEAIIATALERAGVRFSAGQDTRALDFFLPDFDVYIECKRMHSPRISDQMARHDNVIAIQGIGAANAFAGLMQQKKTMNAEPSANPLYAEIAQHHAKSLGVTLPLRPADPKVKTLMRLCLEETGGAGNPLYFHRAITNAAGDQEQPNEG